MKSILLGKALDNEQMSRKKIFQILGDRLGRKKYYARRLPIESDAF